MQLNDYQTAAHKTAVYPQEWGVVYPATGLAGEAGEVAEKIKKMMRDGTLYLSDEGMGVRVSDVMTSAQADAVIKELGGVLWYVAEVATRMGVTLETVARRNIDQLADRSLRGVIIGEGDDR